MGQNILFFLRNRLEVCQHYILFHLKTLVVDFNLIEV